MNETLFIENPYAVLSVDVYREDETSRILTLHVRTKAEWYALFARLIVYGHKEQSMVVVERSPEFVNEVNIEEEKNALEWRLKMLNDIIDASLAGR